MSFTKILGFCFMVLFIAAAAVQLNDVDPWLWVFLYGLAALISLLFVLNKLKPIITLILAVGFVILAFYYWPAQFEGVALQDGMKTTNIELGRESLGMAICALVMLVFSFFSKKR